MLKQQNFIRKNVNLPTMIRCIFFAWLLAVTIEYFLLPSELRGLAQLEGLAQMSLGRIVGITCGISIFLFVLSRFINITSMGRWYVTVAFSVLATATLIDSFSWAYLTACLLILIALIFFGICGWDSRLEPIVAPKKAHKAYLWVTVGLSVAFFLFVSAWTVGRVYSFCAPTYDFGIFSQMFYNMKESGLPMTTVERDGLLSHFDVHVSPVYYLLLPFYCLFPHPATLQVLQAAVITSSVIPLWLIGKHHGLTGTQRMLSCLVLLLFPAFSGGTGYDIHENCFLTPLILWLFYGIDKKSTLITAISAILTLMVKEDAAVYVAVIALWLVVKAILHFNKASIKDILTGVAILGFALLWFYNVTSYLAEQGDGVMTYRYKNFIYDDSSSLLTVVKSVILNPMKAVYECVDTEKLQFIGLTLLPLLGLPFLTRRYERYILLIPYILVNLMPDYTYQHNIFFQYTFGSTACLLYLTVVNLADLRINKHRIIALIGAAAVSAGCFGAVVVPTAMYYPVASVKYYGYYQNIRNALAQVPDNASVAATTFYTTYLSEREVLYDVRYASRQHVLESEYVVMSIHSTGDYARYHTNGKENGFENLVKLLERNGYQVFLQLDNVLVIYYKEISS